MNKRQILIGVAALLVGTFFYLIERPPDQTYFISISPINISLRDTVPTLPAFIANSLPSFVHIFSFILITAGMVCCYKRGYLMICSSWFLVNAAFELGQKYESWSLKVIPDWFAGIPFLENSGNYFRFGTFDILDLGAIGLGGVAAYFALLQTGKRRDLP
jgi:hypothetical protein